MNPNNIPGSNFEEDRLNSASENIAKAGGGVWGVVEDYRTRDPFPKRNAETETKNSTANTPASNIKQPVIKTLRTFQGDIAEAIKEGNQSVLSMKLAERKKVETEEKKIAQTPEHKEQIKHETRKKISLISVSILLIVLGIGVFAFIFFTSDKTPEPIISNPEAPAIISFTKKNTYNIASSSRADILNSISSARDSWVSGAGDVLFLELLQKEEPFQLTSIHRFLSQVDASPPSSLLRALQGEFMMGLFKTFDYSHTFILIKVSSFERAFPGMLSWETKMYKDIGSLFSRKVLNVSPSAQATSTQSSINFENEVEENFEDLTIKNRDARILKNQRGEVVLLYSFLKPDLLLITEDVRVFDAMLDKIIAPIVR